MDAGLSAEEMTAITEEAVERAKADHPELTDFWMRQIVTRGTVDLFDPPAPTVLVQVGEQGFWYADLYDTGMHGVISKTRAYSPQALDPKIKHYSRMNFVLAHQEAHDMDPGAWPILLDDRGFLAEGNGQNVFIVTDGVIRTPTDYAALQGVSRGMAIDLTHQLDIPLVEEDLQPYDLYTADEAFWTTTSMCVMPMTQVDRRPIADGKPGTDVTAPPRRMERGRRHRHRRPGTATPERSYLNPVRPEPVEGRACPPPAAMLPYPS